MTSTKEVMWQSAFVFLLGKLNKMKILNDEWILMTFL